MTRSFLERTVSGIILVVIALVTIILGEDVLLVTIGAVSLIGFYELAKVFGMERKLPGILGYLATAAYYVLLRMDLSEYLLLFFILYLIVLLAAYVFTFPKYNADEIMAVFFGMFYVVLMLSYIYQVRGMEDGKYVVWLIFLCSWGCDTCAYLVGVMFGKHKMAPVLSPKKSVEGGIGGVAGAALLGFVYAYIFQEHISLDNPMILFPVVCAVGGMISQIGDLAASGIKRNHEIKDYGKLIPGHGGILDRFDSVIITAPIIYYFITILG
ncbi:MAG: phosphatidate cytidylyltransferase [Lachnospiraceae bacterium]|nr:phosphatidate cytidylyltransferase [Lachnospiraceae bacterium]